MEEGRQWCASRQCLEPTLFLIYINDVLDNLSSKGKLFADDAKIYRKMDSTQEGICCKMI